MENLLGKMQELLSDPESMKQISELAQMFKSGDLENPPQDSPPPESPPETNPSGFDPGMLLKVGELFNQQEDKNTALLLALRPHLGQTRQLKIDKAIRMLKLWHIWKQLQASGMLQNLL